jgi:Tfp pilus assembly protein PilF
MDGDLDGAEALYKESIAHYPTAEAHTFLGWTYSGRDRLDEAIAECRKAIDVDPTFGNPYNDIGAYLLRQERVDEAIPWFQRALEAPRYESYCFPHMNLGRAWEAKRLWRRALAEYRKALVARPEYRPAREAAVRILGFLN